ncbi:MAG TPA: permease [Myxococcota bacterium]|nr:permease [Myxococcota bacterium]HQK51718.1 permease [Myxococcota bacterium]
MRDRWKWVLVVGVFVAAWFLPADRLSGGDSRLLGALVEALAMLHEYARDHVLLCLVPAFFIAGGISVFVRQASVMRYLGPTASKWVAYPVAAVSGTILAVCSCTVLPLFAGIHMRGAGLGPATAFLYSGPAINVLAIILTARVLGMELGVARALGAIVFAVVIGLLMHALFRKDETARARAAAKGAAPEAPRRALWQDGVFFASMVGVLVFANWGRPPEGEAGFFAAVHGVKWVLTGVSLGVLALALWRWFDRDELVEWVGSTKTFALQILPLLFGGVLVAGFLLGRPGHEGLIPSEWVASLVGGNSLLANFFSAVSGAFMYFATLTEVPILQGLLGSGMGNGPALTLLLAGPALSLPSMLVIRGVLGTKKTVAYVALVILLSTVAGWGYGALA